jgi:hypothetical protein
MEIINLRRKDEARGKGGAVLLATFSVSMGPEFDLNGFELVEYDGKTFVSAPHRFSQETKKKFHYVFFKKGAGYRVLDEITEMALEEYDRRGSGSTPSRGGGGSGYSREGGGNRSSGGGGGYSRNDRSEERQPARSAARSSRAEPQRPPKPERHENSYDEDLFDDED